MQVLNQKIKIKCQIRYTVNYVLDTSYIMNDYGKSPSSVKVKTINDIVNTIETNIIPDIKDNIKVLLLPKRYRSIESFLENGKPITLFPGSDMILDATESEPILIMNKSISITVYENCLKEYAKTNVNKPEWSTGVSVDEIRKLSLDDIFNLYHQTMHKGVMIL